MLSYLTSTRGTFVIFRNPRLPVIVILVAMETRAIAVDSLL